jgi:hypothetical protein
MTRFGAADGFELELELAGLSCDKMMELWLGPGADGSVFRTREELRDAWNRGRDIAMREWAKNGQRPAGFWEFDAADLGLKFPGDERERSYLFERGVLPKAECIELVRFWRREFARSYAPNFFTHRGSEVLYGAAARRAHFCSIDLPASLRRKFMAERKRHAKAIRKLAATKEPPVAQEEITTEGRRFQ